MRYNPARSAYDARRVASEPGREESPERSLLRVRAPASRTYAPTR